jgi:hypothetical protein
MSGFRLIFITRSPPKRFSIAAVAIVVRGHNAFAAIPFGRNSPARPRITMLMPYFAME